jgi:hypothetical protein
MMALSSSPETTAFQCWYVNIFYKICLNNNLRKCHDLRYLSFSFNGAYQINMSKLNKRLPKNATKFGDHLSIISVGNDVQFLALVAPKRG